MGYICDFWGEQRAIVCCRSDAASLCLSCDRNVHSANALSTRHPRTLLCERCNSQPALVRCIEEGISLCQNCDWLGHVSSNKAPSHRRQAVNCYTGCPSAAELSAIWSFLLDFPSVGDSACEQGLGSMSIADNKPRDSEGPEEKNTVQDPSFLVETSDPHNVDTGGSTIWMESLAPLDSKRHNADQLAESSTSGMPKVLLPGAKGPVRCEDDGFYDDLIMDEIDLSLENYGELFGVTHNNSFVGDGIDGLFGPRDMSLSNSQGAHLGEGSSVGGLNVMQPPACGNAASADSVVSCKTEPNLYFTRQGPSSLSFSGLTTGDSAGDYQDSGVSSSMLFAGEPPWGPPPGPESSVRSSGRTDAVLRYKEKKKTRKFERKVRYASRKARADVRRRVKGRFVKAGDAYDYDPLSQTRSY